MKLRSLQLHGFKSFADRTTLEFRDGVTAIVGSNGCGKSNVADAIRWALGEQRASAVRGAKMDEVIFAGSAGRRPLAFAEVLLRFDNSDGSVPVPQSELEIARKTFREGGSEYALNRVACRLRDVQELLRDTGLGGNAPFAIEAGMVDAILSDRADERRALFEEAAGIGSYKDRRRAASRRLAAAEGDLARLVDLLGEVESKVRSLARQRRQAERFAEIRDRRLALEVALAHREIGARGAELVALEERIATLQTEGSAAAAERAAAEAGAEAREREAANLRSRRSAAAARLEQIRDGLGAREREGLVAGERSAHAELRLAQLARENAELAERAGRMEKEAERGAAEAERARRELQGVRRRVATENNANAALRERVAERRRDANSAAVAALAAAREIATAEAARAGFLARADEAARRAERLGAEQARLRDAVAGLGAEAERLEGEVAAAAARRRAASESVAGTVKALGAARVRGEAASAEFRGAEHDVARLEATTAAREALERSFEGYAPAVAALMLRRTDFPGVLGPLAERVSPDLGEAELVDAYLGPLLHAVVVRDREAARAVWRWFRSEWKGGGSLLLLPLDAPALASGSPHGASWAELLLEGARRVDPEELLADTESGPRADPQGDVVDARGVIRLGSAGVGEGPVARRRALERLRSERDRAAEYRDGLRAAREGAAAERQRAEAAERGASEETRAAEAALRCAAADLAALAERRARAGREREAREREAAAARAQAADLAVRAEELGTRLRTLGADAAAADRSAVHVSAALAAAEADWETARDREAELRVVAAQAEAEQRGAERRQGAAAGSAEAARRRLAASATEAAELRDSLASLAELRRRAAAEVEQLFGARDAAAADLFGLEAALEDATRAVRSLEERARDARRREAEGAETRHRLELERAEREARIARSRERLEAEWGRPWEVLVTGVSIPDGDPAEWAAELRDLDGRLEQLGPVNALAAAEHAEEERRLAFVREQESDLQRARADLAAAIREINRTARERFQRTFDQVRGHFATTFESLFQGGECDLWLADPDDPLESPIEVAASPRGKRTQRIGLLSGGERTLAALALLFAIYLVKPSPFCLFDEVDAPLDEANVLRFVGLLDDFKDRTQFIIITHNPRTMEAADWIYGVTMEEPGVSGVVGVALEGVWEAGERVA